MMLGRQAWANSVDMDKTLQNVGLFRVYTVCLSFSYFWYINRYLYTCSSVDLLKFEGKYGEEFWHRNIEGKYWVWLTGQQGTEVNRND